ncbi:SusC/RagA family TonB-linked outer membrane protein [Pseudoflavitalea sp. X16]|uniref:SusC/RagA family TonB-linked outer membrane protein n=1 Tax=Paraflavitalea devenefica TaxID=2716334 RepID=UPI001421905D|nr:SusC/RagA family TonB-linked outer membrane protein [Paraflavitalea devenefica]NII23444.1 SusC/RagA family TonB-linked outer membrane protein [Paraflavitalea devenefica]
MKLTFIPVLRSLAVCLHRYGCTEQLLMIVRFRGNVSRTDSKNILLAMKITAVILLVACLHASAGSYSQSVTLKADNMPLKEVLSEVKKQTGYSFFFKKGSLDQTRPVTLQVQHMPLATFLDSVLKDQPLKYEISVKTITLLPNPPAAISYDRQQQRWAAFREIKGAVTGDGNAPLVGASVKIKGMDAGTYTDANGRFTINAEPGQVLVISYIGYKDKQIKITQETTLSIRLELAASSMDAVVVNKGYYTEKQRLSAGNVATVKAVDIERQPVSNPLAALQGRIPGMVITQNTGMPGSAFTVQLRGRNSIKSGTDPLYIVDDVPYPSTMLNSMQGARNDVTLGGSPLGFLNPQDIESINVLKDADATAIYGSRGANGVVLITTKKGKAGKAQVNANFTQGAGSIGHFMKLLNTRQYLDMRYEAFRNDKVDWRSPTVYTAVDLKSYDTTRYTDWQKELLGGKAEYTDAQLSISGGSANTQYLIGGSYHRETTVFSGNNAADQRGSLHFNVNGISNNQKLRVFLTGGYSVDNNVLPRNDLTDYALNLPPIGPAIYNPDGTLNWAGNNWQNPMARFRAKFKRKTNNFISNLVASYQIMKGLEFRSTFGFTQMLVNETSTTPISSYSPTSGVQSGSADFTTFTNTTWLIEPQLNYTRDIWKGTLNVLVGSTIQQNTTSGLMVYATGFVSDALLGTIGSAATVTPMGNQSRSYKYNSLFGRLNYTIAEKYVVNLTMRRDGSDRFGPNNRFGNFGAVGAAWIFSRENLVANHLPFLSFGKLRASYGTTGNDKIEDFQFMRTYSATTSTLVFQNVRGLAPNNLFNPDYHWEENRKLEAGIELGFLNDKIMTTASYYQNRSDNQLVGYRMPAHTGFSTITANWPALIENRGWEITLNTNDIRLGQVKWSSYFNISWSRNELVAFPGIEKTPYAQTLVIGKSLNITKVYDFVGMDTATGLYQYRNKAGKIVDGLGSNYLTYGTDMTVLVDKTPAYYGGFQNNFSYKGFELDFLFQFAKQIGQGYYAQYNPGSGSPTMGNMPVEVLDRWQKPGNNAAFPRFNATRATAVNYTSFRDSDGGYMDASFIRLKNVQLAYDFARLIGKKIGVQTLRAYIQAQNLFTITNYFGLDPENQQPVSLPPLRVITAGIKITI